MSSFKAIVALGLLATAQLAASHGVITDATGDAGGSGMALGVDPTTPRDGTRRNPFQQDSTRFRGASAATVGETLGAGTNSIESGTRAILAMTGDQLPQISAGGQVKMTLHQVNADGAGPYTCMISSDATAEDWAAIDVVQSPPGKNSRDRDGNETDFPLTAAIPEDQTCTGTVAGQDNACLVRCQNGARAGPFGGVVPVQMVNGNNSTSTAATRRDLARAIRRNSARLTQKK
ncbi:hypothetical protein F5B19DRAFT_388757 [Rostrohypoxylon terebratum]|nr:hypothetical protein F5B19DRAFT_388757 [Rostrohypoxylon terebratum]